MMNIIGRAEKVPNLFDPLVLGFYLQTLLLRA